MQLELNRSVAALRRTPAVLKALLAGVPDDWLRADEGAGTWSAADVVAHLIGGEEVDWMSRTRIILAQGESRAFAPVNRSGAVDALRGRPIADLLTRFAELRERNLAELERLRIGEAQLALLGDHPAFGPVTLAQLLATWVVHDLNHLAQVARVLAKQYKDAVGPWQAYLPLLTR